MADDLLEKLLISVSTRFETILIKFARLIACFKSVKSLKRSQRTCEENIHLEYENFNNLKVSYL